MTSAIGIFALAGVLVGAVIFAAGIVFGVYLSRGYQGQKPAPARKKRRAPGQRRDEAVPVFQELPAEESPAEHQNAPPELDRQGRAAVALHARAVEAYNRGEHEEAQHLMQKALNDAAPLQNPWLDEELLAEYRSLLCVIRDFDQADYVGGLAAAAREYLGNAPASNYLQDKIGDLGWMARAAEYDMEKSEEAFRLHRRSMNALEEGDQERAAELANQALQAALQKAGPDHWITAVMLNGRAEVAFERENLSAAVKDWKKAQLILSDWDYAAPGLRRSINHNLKMAEQFSEGEDWKEND